MWANEGPIVPTGGAMNTIGLIAGAGSTSRTSGTLRKTLCRLGSGVLRRSGCAASAAAVRAQQQVHNNGVACAREPAHAQPVWLLRPQ